jgi:hypothetical protein
MSAVMAQKGDFESLAGKGDHEKAKKTFLQQGKPFSGQDYQLKGAFDID